MRASDRVVLTESSRAQLLEATTELLSMATSETDEVTIGACRIATRSFTRALAHLAISHADQAEANTITAQDLLDRFLNIEAI